MDESHNKQRLYGETLVLFDDAQGLALRAGLVHFTRFAAVIELYAATTLKTSEVLSNFRILTGEQVVYAGKAVVRSVVPTGTLWICELQLEDAWIDLKVLSLSRVGKGVQEAFREFVQSWQKLYRIENSFKVVVAEIQAFLSEMRLWAEHLELGIRSRPDGDRLELEQEIAVELTPPTISILDQLFHNFESAGATIPEGDLPVHRHFSRKQLHPLLLCSPFLYRTFTKPLGYAGDFEMVNMIMRDPNEGGSLFAKLVNAWFISQPPAEAHRNRIRRLHEAIVTATCQAAALGRPARIVSLGCGPAHEVQQFLAQSEFADRAQFTLIDFSDDALAHVQSRVDELKGRYQRRTQVNTVKKSVNQLLKEAARGIHRAPEQQFDLVYCAGLFDYLTDPICHHLHNLLYQWVVPGGTLLSTNVDASNPRKVIMDLIMEWHLVYRTGTQLAALKPESARADDCAVRSDISGVNLYFESRKPVPP